MGKGRVHEPIEPVEAIPSAYGPDPDAIEKRGYEYPDIVSLELGELFPDLPESIYTPNGGAEKVKESTLDSLKKEHVEGIDSGDTVNVLGSHHGFTILGGKPYAEVIKGVKDFVEEETEDTTIKLRVGVGLRFKEADEYIEKFGLDEYFDGRAKGIAPIDRGEPIDTEIGRLYGIKSAYDADHIVHTHNSDVREIHFHRHVDRAVKPFGMSYARIETRSTYHHNLGPRGANFVARAIFDTSFVQDKFAFTTFLKPFPGGIAGVESSKDLYDLNERLTKFNFETYGKIITLLSEIDECITVLDYQCPIPYVFSGGVIFANFSAASVDLFDLETPVPGYTWYTESFYDKEDKPLAGEIPPLNPAIKSLVINYAWGGYPSEFWAKHLPTIVAGEEQAKVYNNDPQNAGLMKHALIADNYDSAMDYAKKIADTDKIIIFDGAPGGINVSNPLADELIEKAPKVSKKVEEELMPKWLDQRGLE